MFRSTKGMNVRFYEMRVWCRGVLPYMCAGEKRSRWNEIGGGRSGLRRVEMITTPRVTMVIGLAEEYVQEVSVFGHDKA